MVNVIRIQLPMGKGGFKRNGALGSGEDAPSSDRSIMPYELDMNVKAAKLWRKGYERDQ